MSSPILKVALKTLLLLGSLGLMFGADWLGSGKRPEAAPIIAPVICLLVMTLPVRASRRPVLTDLPVEVYARLRAALADIGLKSVKLTYATEGRTAQYPRPLAFPGTTTISKRVLDEFSPAALDWSVKTDSLSAAKLITNVFPFLYLCLIAAMFFLGYSERVGGALFPIIAAGLIVLAFASIAVGGMWLQFAADRRLTVTEQDRTAALEALSRPFFAQAEQPPGNRWTYSRLELKARAKRLGIHLAQESGGFEANPAGS